MSVTISRAEWDPCSLNEWNVAKTAALFMKGLFRYIGNGKWEYFDTDLKTWNADTKNQRILRYMQTCLCEPILCRAQELCTSTEFDHRFMFQNLLGIAKKLQNATFRKKVLTELQGFLDDI